MLDRMVFFEVNIREIILKEPDFLICKVAFTLNSNGKFAIQNFITWLLKHKMQAK